MATGDIQDIVQGLKSALPRGWFSGSTPVLDALLTGLATAWSEMYSIYQYVSTQARIRTATGIWLDLAAQDFFGNNLPRQANELDAQYRARILSALFVEQGTRNAIYYALLRLTGRAPLIFEPARPADTGAYTQPLLSFVNRWSNGVVRGNAQAAAAKSLTLSTTDASAADTYATSAVRIVAGTGAGQERKGVASRTNLITSSANMLGAGWNLRAGGTIRSVVNGALDPWGGTTGQTVTVGAAYVDDIWQTAPNVPTGANQHLGLWIKRISTTGTLTILNPQGFGGGWTINMALLPDAYVYLTEGNPAVSGAIVGVSNNGGVQLYGSAAISFLFGGLELELSSPVGEFIKTNANQANGVSVDRPWSSNLLTYSQAFERAVWTQQGITVTPNAVTAPDGSLSGEVFASATGYTVVWRYGITIVAGSVVTLSAYFKAGTTSLPSLTVGNSVLTNAMTCQFNLVTGTAGAVTYIGTTTGASAAIQNAGNGWYRCSITGVIDGSTTAVRCDLPIPNSSNCYVWGAQLEVGTTPSPYVATADVPVLAPDATSVYDISPSAYSAAWPTNACLIGYGNAGGYGSLQMPYQALVKAYLPSTSGIPLVTGYGVLASPLVGASNGAYNTPSRTEYAALATAQNNLGLTAIYQAVDAAKPAGTIVWVGTSQ